ncbi:MAG: TolC family protein, partial [Planctomycetales bacterium]
MAVRQATCGVLGLIVLALGCATPRAIRDPEYADFCRSARQSRRAPGVDVVNPVFPDLEGPHRVEDYVRFALNQNPDVHAARKRMESVAHRVPVAASLQDPTLGMTFFPEPIQTAAGQQEFALSAKQKLPWRGKLRARSDLVESQANAARAQLAAVELAVIAKVKRAYFELYFIQQALAVTQADRELLLEIREVASVRYRTAKTSQQDVLRAELEISNVEAQLIRLRQQLASGQARLARALHVSPQTKVRALDRLQAEPAPRDLERLLHQAVAA